MLAAEQSRVRRIFVDEYQDVDPAQARLIELLASGADELVVFGDPDQSIYAFRGSDPGALRDIEVDATVSLTVSRRLAPAVLTATRRVAATAAGRLAAPGAGRTGRVLSRTRLPRVADRHGGVAGCRRRAR